METEDIDKILSKSYSDLSPSERETVQEICSSEEEFMQLQQFFASVENYAQEIIAKSEPSPAVKDNLDHLFHQTYQNKGILWYNSVWMGLYPADKQFFQKPLVRIAAILILLISIVPLFNGPSPMEPKSLAKNERISEKTRQKGPDKEPASAENKKELKPAVLEMPAVNGVQDEGMDNFSAIEPAEAAPMQIAALKPAGEAFKDKVQTKLLKGTYTSAMEEKYTIEQKNGSTGLISSGYFHPDGIYLAQDSINQLSRFSVKQNLAVLDLLTPTF